MRYIDKGVEPLCFTLWKASGTPDWQPSYPELRNPEKAELHAALITEQLGNCCYCGRRIQADESHLEHFAPQEHFEDRALSYENIHASCIRDNKRGNPLHCGHGKSSDFDEVLAISPMDPGCEERFSYGRFTGSISATDPTDDAAVYMIKLLKLDIASLRTRRLKALDGLFTEDIELNASVYELQHVLASVEAADANGHQDSFAHVLAYHARSLIAARMRAG